MCITRIHFARRGSPRVALARGAGAAFAATALLAACTGGPTDSAAGQPTPARSVPTADPGDPETEPGSEGTEPGGQDTEPGADPPPGDGDAAAADEPPPLDRGCGWHGEVGIVPEAETPAVVAAVLSGGAADIRRELDAGADPDAVDPQLVTTPLFAAAEADCEEMVALLLEAGASPDVIAPGGEAPLSVAVNVGNAEAVERLLAAGADPSQAGGFDIASPLHEAAGVGRLSILALLAPHASDLDVGAQGQDPLETGEDTGQGSPVEFAAGIPCASCLELLLDAGASPTPTAVYRSVVAGSEEALRALLEAGADAGTTGDGTRRRLVELAREHGHAAVVELLEEWEP